MTERESLMDDREPQGRKEACDVVAAARDICSRLDAARQWNEERGRKDVLREIDFAIGATLGLRAPLQRLAASQSEPGHVAPVLSEGRAAPAQSSAKLDLLRRHFERLGRWGREQGSDNAFAEQVARYAEATLLDWDLPPEEWEP